MRKEGKATQLKTGGYPNRYTALAADVLPLIQGEGEEYALSSGCMEKPNLRSDSIRDCPFDATLTIDAWDLS